MRLWPRRKPWGIQMDDVGVRRVHGDTTVESVAWADLAAVDIRTTAGGPFAEDVFWLLSSQTGGGVAVPPGHMPEGLLERLQALPGFDNGALIEAMSCTSNQLFHCWSSSGTADQ